MGKYRQRFNKKQSVRFALVNGPVENGKPTTRFEPLQNRKNSTISQKQREKIIQEISDQVYDEIEINGKKMGGESQIPAFILEQIRGRKDLVFNQLGKNSPQMQMMGFKRQINESQEYQQGDMYEEQFIDAEDAQWEQGDGEDQQQWQDDQNMIEEVEQEEHEMSESEQQKQFKLKEEEFPTLSNVSIQGYEGKLTEAQIKLLDVLLPQNYDQYQIEGLKFEKYDQDGLPLSQKQKYQKYLPTGKEGIIDTFEYVPEKPLPIYDNDLKPSQIVGDLKQIQDALNYSGQEEAYEELEDDFFAKLIQSQIKSNKKTKKQNTKATSKVKKTSKVTILNEPSLKQLPAILEQNTKKQENIFAKYDQLDQDHLDQQITDDMLEKALDDFQQNIQPAKVKGKDNLRQQEMEEQEQQDRFTDRSQISMNYAQIESRQEYFGRDGELDWRCLSKKQKKEYMKTKIIRQFYDEVRERQIDDKLKGKKNVTAEQLHLKTLIKHIPFSEDHVMQRQLEKDAQQEVHLSDPQQYTESSDQQDITQYHQRTSVISSNLNQISEPAKKKKKNKDSNSQLAAQEMEKLALSISQIKVVTEKRDKNQTKQQRKQRKQKRKQLKKQKKQLKKQFVEKFSEQRRKQMKMTKPSNALHKVSYVKII